MKLSQIIKSSAERMSDVTVDVRSIYGLVRIRDDTGTHEDIYLQGDDASSFISVCEQAWSACSDVTKNECYLWQAEPYVECIWSWA